jgi:hypothetical protein
MLNFYAECHYAKSCILFTIMLSVVMISVVLLSVVAPFSFLSQGNKSKLPEKLSVSSFSLLFEFPSKTHT